MLINCPECALQVSDKADFCPHCGYPFKTFSKKSTREKSPKKMRLPNGFGQISEIKDKPLRNRFRAMVTVGHKPDGRAIVKPLKPHAYFKTYNDAYQALVEYNRNPYDLSDDLTVSELHEKWMEHFDREVSELTLKNYRTAWKHSAPLYEMRFRDVRGRHIKNIIAEAPAGTQSAIRSIWNQMYSYALEYELVEKNYLEDVSIPDKRKPSEMHKAISKDELAKLWTIDDPVAKMILIQCYSGWRPIELLNLKTADININEWSMTGGAKTSAGKNRIVPIHSCIRELVMSFYDPDNFYLFPIHKYNPYCDRFKELLPNHLPHDPRKTFITLAKEHDVNEYALKRMAGHTITDITEKIYTERSIDWLREEIEKIKGPA